LREIGYAHVQFSTIELENLLPEITHKNRGGDPTEDSWGDHDACKQGH